jgi:RimJ/RimL family protein N-acetyltransferase
MAGMPERIGIDTTLALRSYERTDTRSVLDLVEKNFDVLHQWMPWAQTRPTLADEEGFIELCISKWAAGTEYNFRIEDGGAGVGSIGIWPVEHDPALYEVGYWLDEDHWGRGICTRSVDALIAATHDALGVTRFSIRCDEANERSRAVAVRAGFALETTAPYKALTAGQSGVTLTFTRRLP